MKLWYALILAASLMLSFVSYLTGRNSGIDKGRALERAAIQAESTRYCYEVVDRNVSPPKFYKIVLKEVPNPYDDSGRRSEKKERYP
jgi:hypothetical protein